MKRIVCTFLLLTACLAASTQAVTWSFNFESLDGTMDTWESGPPPVETGAVGYDYQWELTQADMQLSSGGLPVGWTTFLGGLPADVVSGSGTKASLPFQLSPINIIPIVEPPENPGVTAMLFLNVLADGTAGGSLGNIIFSPLGDGVDVTGVRIAGDFTVTPEPATLLLLGLGGLALLRKRC
jgi:hypothetical protein